MTSHGKHIAFCEYEIWRFAKLEGNLGLRGHGDRPHLVDPTKLDADDVPADIRISLLNQWFGAAAAISASYKVDLGALIQSGFPFRGTY